MYPTEIFQGLVLWDSGGCPLIRGSPSPSKWELSVGGWAIGGGGPPQRIGRAPLPALGGARPLPEVTFKLLKYDFLFFPDEKLTLLVNLGVSWHEKLTLLFTHFSLPILACPFHGHWKQACDLLMAMRHLRRSEAQQAPNRLGRLSGRWISETVDLVDS